MQPDPDSKKDLAAIAALSKSKETIVNEIQNFKTPTHYAKIKVSQLANQVRHKFGK